MIPHEWTAANTGEMLEDDEVRAAYGSQALKYEIAVALVTARTMRNLTQAEYATLAGVSQSYLAKLERGEANPPISRIGSLLSALWLRGSIHVTPLLETAPE